MNTPPLQRLIRIALGDSGQSHVVADFLLAWWNADEYGGFDLTDVWAVDVSIAEDILMVFEQIVHSRNYPDALGYEKQFQTIAHQWRTASR
jgi:hypothetical protein